MAVSLLGVSSFFFFQISSPIFIVILLTMFKSSFSIGLGANTWLINSEIYPIGIRGRAIGISSFMNWMANYLVSISFLSLLNGLGNSSTFLLYSVICVVAYVFIQKKVPETRNQTLAQAHEHFKK